MSAYPRLMFTAAGGGCGKTMVTCAFLQAAMDRGLLPAAFRCGAKCTDSGYHQKVSGVKSRHLDLYLSSADTVRSLLYADAGSTDLAVLDGNRGFYDGIGETDSASSWEICCVSKTPAVLIVEPQDSMLTLSAQVLGLLHFRAESHIRALLLNRCTAEQYQILVPLLERETGLPVVGYFPPLKINGQRKPDCGELPVLTHFTHQMDKTVDFDLLMKIACTAPELHPAPLPSQPITETKPRIAVARDEAFCFSYRENLELLKHLGAELLFFSPLQDAVLPRAEALYLGSGRPELFAEQLSRNISMRESIRRAVLDGLPTVTEDGGFFYLSQSLESTDGVPHPMAGVLPGRSFHAPAAYHSYAQADIWQDSFLCRKGTRLPVSICSGNDSDARGPGLLMETANGQKWTCGFATSSLFSSIARLYFFSDPTLAANFVRAAAERVQT